MNYYLLISGVLTIIMAIVHSILGEIKIIEPIQKTEKLPVTNSSTLNTKLTLRFAWHVTSVLGIGMAVILLYYARFEVFTSDRVFVLRTLAVTFFISFLVSIVGSRAKHPSWIIFIISSVLTWLSTG